MSDLKFSHSGGGASNGAAPHSNPIRGLAAFHTFENNKDETRSSSRFVGGAIVALMIAVAIGYSYETMNAPAPPKPVANASQNNAAPHAVATTPAASVHAANTVTPPVVSPAPVLKQAAAPVMPRPAPIHKPAKAAHAAPAHHAVTHKRHAVKAAPDDSAMVQRMKQSSQTPAAIVPPQQPLAPDTINSAPASTTPPANDMTPVTPAQTAPEQTMPQTTAPTMPQSSPASQMPAQPQSAPMQ